MAQGEGDDGGNPPSPKPKTVKKPRPKFTENHLMGANGKQLPMMIEWHHLQVGSTWYDDGVVFSMIATNITVLPPP